MRTLFGIFSLFIIFLTAQTAQAACEGAPPNGALTGHVGYERKFLGRDGVNVIFQEDNRLPKFYSYGFYGLVASRVSANGIAWNYQDAYDYLMGKKGSIEYVYVTAGKLAAINMTNGTLSPCSDYTGWAIAYKGILLFAIDKTIQGYCYNPFWHSGTSSAPEQRREEYRTEPTVSLPNAIQYATTGGTNTMTTDNSLTKGGWTFIFSPRVDFAKVGLVGNTGWGNNRPRQCNNRLPQLGYYGGYNPGPRPRPYNPPVPEHDFHN